MRKIGLIVLLGISVTLVYGQRKTSIGGEITYSYNNFKSHEAPPSSNEIDGNINTVYALLKIRKELKNLNKLSFDLGVGMGYETVIFSTFITLDKLNIAQQPGYDTLNFRGQLRRNLSLAVPIGLSYKIKPYTGNKIPGIRLNVNTLHEFVVSNIHNFVAIDYDVFEPILAGYAYRNDELEQDIKDFYEPYNKNYRLTAKIGAEAFYAFEKYELSGGINYHAYFLSPFEYKVKNRPSYSVFIAVMF